MSRLRARLTLLATVILFLGGTAYGYSLLTQSTSTAVAGPTCEPKTITAGQDVTTNLIKVNVYNASFKSGLATSVNIALQRNGFLAGLSDNAAKVMTRALPSNTVAIVTTDKTDPQVKLVAAQFRQKVIYVAPLANAPSGVNVVVNSDWKSLASKPLRAVKSDRTLNFCLATVTVN